MTFPILVPTAPVPQEYPLFSWAPSPSYLDVPKLPYHEKSLLPVCTLAVDGFGFSLPAIFCPAQKHELQLSSTAARGQGPRNSLTQTKGLMQHVTLFPSLEITLNWGCIS